MLFQHRLDPDGGYDLEQLVMQLHEDLDVDAFVAAWQHVVARHPALRTQIGRDADENPVQQVRAQWTMPVEIGDWRAVASDEDAVAERTRTFLRADRRRGFDLDDAPPLRLFVTTLGDGEAFACWSFHHIILDGRSFGIVLADVFAAYESIRAGRDPSTTLPAAPRPFGDFVDWITAQDAAAHLPFWKGLLADKDAPTPLPPLRAASAPEAFSSPGYGELSLVVAPKTTKKLRALATTSKSTLGTVVQAAWALTLNRLTGDDDVVFGTTRACRRSAFADDTGAAPGADDMVGLFINTLPVRAQIVDDEPLTALLSSLREQSVAVRAHEHTPLVDVLGQSGVPRGTPLFQTLLMFENQELNATLRAQDPAFAHRHFHYEEQPTFPLNVTVFDHGKKQNDGVDVDHLEVRVLFDRGRFADVGIEKLLGWFEAVLSSMTKAKTTADVQLLPSDERTAILFDDANDTAKDVDSTLLLHELFEARVDAVRASKSRPAALISADGDDGGDRSLDVIELEERANQLAWHLREQGAVRGSYVGILLERGLDLVVALMAVSTRARVTSRSAIPVSERDNDVDTSAKMWFLSAKIMAVVTIPTTTRIVIKSTPSVVEMGRRRCRASRRAAQSPPNITALAGTWPTSRTGKSPSVSMVSPPPLRE